MKIKGKNLLKKFTASTLAFAVVASALPVGFSTSYVQTVAAQASTSTTTVAADQITGLTVSASPTSFKTWGDIASEVTVILGVAISDTYTSGGIIKLPLPTPPTGSNWVDPAVPEAFFSLVNPDAHNLVSSYDTTTEPGTLIIRLKSKTEAGINGSVLASIPLKFQFNEKYLGKVPNGTVLYTAAPRVYMNENPVNITVTPVKVSSGAVNTLSNIQSLIFPKNTKYQGGSMRMRFGHVFNNYHAHKLDPNYENRLWIRVPAGTTGIPQAYHNQKKTVTIGGVSYDEYYRVIDPTIVSGDWTRVSPLQDEGYADHLREYTFLPPDSVQNIGTTFKIETGMDFKFINESSPRNMAIRSHTFTRIQEEQWNLYLEWTHDGASSIQANTGIENNDVSPHVMRAFSIGYFSPWWSKNMGFGPIKWTKFELFHTDENSKQVRFDFFELVSFRETTEASWGKYRHYYEIADTKWTETKTDDTTRTDTQSTYTIDPSIWAAASATTKWVRLTMPILSPTEYIKKVVVIPMGTDGQTEWDFAPKGSFRLDYKVKAWDNKTFPDGTPVGLRTTIPLQWTFSYLDNPNKPASYPAEWDAKYNQITPKTYTGYTMNATYSNGPHAYANIESLSTTNAKVGDTLTYMLYGYNADYFTSYRWVWKNPKIILRTPKFVTVKDMYTPKILTEIAEHGGNRTATYGTTATVRVNLESTDEQYNYYSFQAENYTAPRLGFESVKIFQIPVEFQIVEGGGIQTGTYEFKLYTSQEDSENFTIAQFGTLNDMSDGVTREKLGLPPNGNWNTSGPISWKGHPKSSTLTIIPEPNISSVTAIKNSSTGGRFAPAMATNTRGDNYPLASIVPAQSGEDVTIRLTIANNGTTELEKIKLYNILPYNGDPLKSQGQVVFKGVASNAAVQPSVKTTRTAVTQLAGYGEHVTGTEYNPDLQAGTALPGDWVDGITTTGAPTALQLDYGNTRLKPGEKIETDLIFSIPDQVTQTVFNQFRYSAIDTLDRNIKFNFNTTPAGFSTEYRDTIHPVLTLAGTETMDVKHGSVFRDPGADWTDNIDGSGKLTQWRVVEINGAPVSEANKSFDNSILGTQKIEYQYTDAAGNPSNIVYRTVRVVDGTPPVLNFNTGITVENDVARVSIGQNVAFNPADYVSCEDNSLSCAISSAVGMNEPTTSGHASVDTSTAGQQTITYKAEDAAGNKTIKRLILTINDTTKPQITLNGSDEITMTVGDVYTDAGATWTDNVDGSGHVEALSLAGLDTTEIGDYILEYAYTDRAGNASNTIRRTIKVVPADKSVFNRIYAELDYMYGNISNVVSNDPNLSIEGARGLIDSLARKWFEISLDDNTPQREINDFIRAFENLQPKVIMDREAPVIHIPNTLQDKYVVGSTVDIVTPVTAIDDILNKDFTNAMTIKVSGPLGSGDASKFDPNVAGTYTIEYEVRDDVDNIATKYKTIVIEPADNSLLANKITEAENILQNPKIVANDEKRAFVELLDQAKTMMQDMNAKPADIEQKILALQDAIAALTIDMEWPNITLAPDAVNSINIGDSIDLMNGIRVEDNIDGDRTDAVTFVISRITGFDNNNTPITAMPIHYGNIADATATPQEVGSYLVTYEVRDNLNNPSTITRVITVNGADFSELNAKILAAEAEIVDTNIVSNGEKEAFVQAIEAAKSVLANTNATQAQVDEAVARISATQNALVKRDPSIMQEMTDLIHHTEAMLTHPLLVHNATVQKILEKIQESQALQHNPSATNEMYIAIQEEIRNLSSQIIYRSPDIFDRLTQAIKEIELAMIQYDVLRDDQYTLLDEKINHAKTLIGSTAVSDEQILALIDLLYAEKDKLNRIKKPNWSGGSGNWSGGSGESNTTNGSSGGTHTAGNGENTPMIPRNNEADAPKPAYSEDILPVGTIDPSAPHNSAPQSPEDPFVMDGSGNNSGNNSGNTGNSGNRDGSGENTGNNSDANANADVNMNVNNNPDNTPARIPQGEQNAIPSPDSPNAMDIPSNPRMENGNILTQKISKKETEDGNTLYSVDEPITPNVCTDIVRVHEYKNLLIRDIDANHPFHDDIVALMMFRGSEQDSMNLPEELYEEYKKNGVVLNAVYFEPNRSVTRAEFVKMLARSLSCQYEFLGKETQFSDVAADAWYAEYIRFAVEKGWINGYSDGTFRPNNPITRDEAAKILSRAIGLEIDTQAQAPFVDIEQNSEFSPYIESLRQKGIMRGRSDEIFAPKDHIPRTETTRIIYRTFFGGKI